MDPFLSRLSTAVQSSEFEKISHIIVFEKPPAKKTRKIDEEIFWQLARIALAPIQLLFFFWYFFNSFASWCLNF